MLECLIRSFPSEVYQGICYDGNASERMSNAIRYIGYAPVCELLVMVIGLTPIARTSQLFIMSAKSRYSFFEELCGWNLMLQITNVVTAPDKCCQIDGSVTGEQHSCAATLLMQELVEKLSLEDSGELLLQPFGYTTELLDQLIDTAINNKALTFLRSHSAKIVCFLLRRAAEAEIMCFINYGTGAPPTATFVANRLYPLRERIVNHVRTRLNDINDSLITFESFMVGIDSVKYSSYEVKIPFTALRSLNVELLVLMAESDETVAGAIPPELWKLFMNWSIVYANNNIYHSLFYRLVFAVLR